MKAASPDPKMQKAGKSSLRKLFSEASKVSVIHYSCENFYDNSSLQGKSPRITSIAVRNLDSAQTQSFSIHQMAEREKIELSQIEDSYDKLERKMLDDFYAFIGKHGGMKYIHWNMRDANFGFAAIEHRYQVLGGTPKNIDDRDKFDLARLLIDIYGIAYIAHPRLENLLNKNSISKLAFLAGSEEAKAFEDRNWVWPISVDKDCCIFNLTRARQAS
jgi:hypothetical protein